MTTEKTIQALFLSYDGMTDALGQSQVIPYLIGLSKRNMRFTLISFEKSEPFTRSANTIRDLLHKNNITWVPLSYTKNPPVLSSMLDVWRLKKTVKKILEEQKIDVIHSRSYIPALTGLWAKKNRNTKFIFDMRGLWADERVDGKLWNLENPVYRSVYNYFKKKEIEFLTAADHTISLTHAAKEEILSWPQLQKKNIPIEVIPCCVDMEVFDPANVTATIIQDWRDKLKITKNDFVLSYVGSIGTWYMLDEMLLFFKKLQEKIPAAKFLFITRDEHARIRERAALLGIESSIIIQPADRVQVPGLLSVSNLSVFFILPAYSKKASSPTKQGEIMAMGIPAVCNSGVGDTDHIIQEYHSGYIVRDWNMEATIDAITANTENFSKEKIMAGAREYFSLQIGIDKFAAIYRSLSL